MTLIDDVPDQLLLPILGEASPALWEAAQGKGRTVRVFGEYAPPQDDSDTIRTSLLTQYRDSQPHNPAYFRAWVGQYYRTRSDIPSLDRTLVREAIISLDVAGDTARMGVYVTRPRQVHVLLLCNGAPLYRAAYRVSGSPP